MVFERSSLLYFYLSDDLGYFREFCTLGYMIMVLFYFRLICDFWLEGF